MVRAFCGDATSGNPYAQSERRSQLSSQFGTQPESLEGSVMGVNPSRKKVPVLPSITSVPREDRGFACLSACGLNLAVEDFRSQYACD
jgi:hypothetical protein